MSTTTKSRLEAIKRAIKEDDVAKLTAVPQWTSLLSRLPYVVNVMVQHSRVKCLEAVLASDAHVKVDSKTPPYDDTPIIDACGEGKIDAVRTLLRHRHKRPINLEQRTVPWNVSPLSFACNNGHYAVVKELLTVDSLDLNSKVGMAFTPLTCAVTGVHSPFGDGRQAHKIVRLLANDARCDVNGQNLEGCTALHLAVQGDRPCVDIVRELLVDRCDPTVKDSHGRVAIQYARSTQVRALVAAFMTEQAKRKTEEEELACKLS